MDDGVGSGRPALKFTYNIKINISHALVKLLYGLRISLLNHAWPPVSPVFITIRRILPSLIVM